MHHTMPKGGPVQLADPRADEARPATISMIAIAAGGFGVLFMLGLARVLPAAESPVHRVVPQAAEPAAAEAASETSVHAATRPPAADPTLKPVAVRSEPPTAAALATAGVAATPDASGTFRPWAFG